MRVQRRAGFTIAAAVLVLSTNAVTPVEFGHFRSLMPHGQIADDYRGACAILLLSDVNRQRGFVAVGIVLALGAPSGQSSADSAALASIALSEDLKISITWTLDRFKCIADPARLV
jgi:hypothetical protein